MEVTEGSPSGLSHRFFGRIALFISASYSLYVIPYVDLFCVSVVAAPTSYTLDVTSCCSIYGRWLALCCQSVPN